MSLSGFGENTRTGCRQKTGFSHSLLQPKVFLRPTHVPFHSRFSLRDLHLNSQTSQIKPGFIPLQQLKGNVSVSNSEYAVLKGSRNMVPKKKNTLK